MVYEKRVVSATIWGVVFGFISWALAMIGKAVPASGVVTIILSFSVMGFVIGISAWKIRWWIHGFLMGLIIILPSSFGAIWAGRGWGAGFIPTIVTGIVFGFLIELLTTVVFKAEMREGKAKEEPEKKEEKKEKKE